MKVKALTGFVHFKPDGDWIVAQPGQELDMPPEAEWVRDGLAIPVEDIPPVKDIEMATIKPGEVSRPPRARAKPGEARKLPRAKVKHG